MSQRNSLSNSELKKIQYTFVAQFDDDTENDEDLLTTSLLPLIESLASPVRVGRKCNDLEKQTLNYTNCEAESEAKNEANSSLIKRFNKEINQQHRGSEMEEMNAEMEVGKDISVAKNQDIDRNQIPTCENDIAAITTDADGALALAVEVMDTPDQVTKEQMSPVIPTRDSFLKEEELLFEKISSYEQEWEDHKFALWVSRRSEKRYGLRSSSQNTSTKVLHKTKKK